MNDYWFVFFLCEEQLPAEQFLLILLQCGIFGYGTGIIQTNFPHSDNARLRQQFPKCLCIKNFLRMVRMDADDGKLIWKSASKLCAGSTLFVGVGSVDADNPFSQTRRENRITVSVKHSVLQVAVRIHHHALLTT